MRKVQRAFHGLVGLPPEPEEAGVVVAPTPIVAAEPVVPEKPKPSSSLTRLASLQPRPRRDPNTGNVIEADDISVDLHVHTLRAMWRTALQSAGVNLYVKCVHGHMYAESYCEVCRLSPVDPDYDPDVYRTEIDKATKRARKSLTGSTWKKPRFENIEKLLDEQRKPITEGTKDYQNLLQIIDIEIWKASKKYGEGMNESLAYTIAQNQAGKYITERIREQTVETNDRNGNVFRIPRFESTDNKSLDDNGNEMTTAAEIAVEASEGTDFTPIEIEQLQALVAGWRGEKRLVGEAMLRPGFTVRNVPGVSKSSAARVRQVVLKEFKSFISQGLTK